MHLSPGCAVAGPARSGGGCYSGGPDTSERRGIICSIAAGGAVGLPRMRRYSLVNDRSCASLVFGARCRCSGLANRCVRPFSYREVGGEIMALRLMRQPPAAALMRRSAWPHLMRRWLHHLNETRCGASLNYLGRSWELGEFRGAALCFSCLLPAGYFSQINGH